ncbi:MAG: hypothetical protein ACI4LM_04040 [Anaerovoracaceae bacterium]
MKPVKVGDFYLAIINAHVAAAEAYPYGLTLKKIYCNENSEGHGEDEGLFDISYMMADSKGGRFLACFTLRDVNDQQCLCVDVSWYCSGADRFAASFLGHIAEELDLEIPEEAPIPDRPFLGFICGYLGNLSDDIEDDEMEKSEVTAALANLRELCLARLKERMVCNR